MKRVIRLILAVIAGLPEGAAGLSALNLGWRAARLAEGGPRLASYLRLVEQIERLSQQIEQVAKTVPGVSSALAERVTGGRYVDVAVMGSFFGHGHKAPMTLAGADAPAVAAWIRISFASSA